MSDSNHFELVTLKSGLQSLRSLKHGETFHPDIGPRVEAGLLHVEQQRLLERCQGAGKFVIWDVGFGAAANALAVVEALRECEAEIELHSFDKTTAPMEFALRHAAELGYLAEYQSELHTLLKDGSVELGKGLHWKLHRGDFREQLQASELLPPQAILYDPYSPTENPEMWTLGHFTRLKERLAPATPCLLTNYTRSTAVRVGLLLAGFYVGVGCALGNKAETTIASNQLALLSNPLGRDWLERVRRSGNAAPLRTATYSKSPISEVDFQALCSLPQFE